VTETVRTDRSNAGPLTGPAHDEGHPVAGQAPDRGHRRQKRRPAGSVWPASAQVVGDGLTDLDGKRHDITTAALGVDYDLTAPPVEVLEIQAGDLRGTQSEADEHQQHRCVAPSASG
jgi:hypothetical protein